MDHKTSVFIREHIHQDVRHLALQGKKYPGVDMSYAASQIAACQKVKDKVPVFYKPGELEYPQGLSIEQSSSEITARYKSGLISGESMIDLTGGFGIDFYFMSQQFKHAIYVERQEELCRIAKHNFSYLNLNNFEIRAGESETLLNDLPDVDWIYIDPHRRSETGKKVFRIRDCEPDVTKLNSLLLQKSKHVLIKLSPMLDISSAINDLTGVSEVYVVSVENECKEIILKLDRNQSHEMKIITENILKNNDNQKFTYLLNEEKNAEVKISDSIGTYLYEPNASVLKSGAFKLLTLKFPLNKLHVNTHLYTSDEYLPGFPGKIFEIRELYRFEKKHLKRLVEDFPKANIASRNFILSVDEFRKRTGIKDGGENYIYLCKDHTESNIILVCVKK